MLERYVNSTNQGLISRDAGEKAVFDVGPKWVGDDHVFARQPDTHVIIQANGAPKTLRRQLVLLHLPPQRHGADVQGLGGLFPVALVTLERAANQLAFLRSEIQRISDLDRFFR